jgi:DNA-binding transcriptional ArsR family regulator
MRLGRHGLEFIAPDFSGTPHTHRFYYSKPGYANTAPKRRVRNIPAPHGGRLTFRPATLILFRMVNYQERLDRTFAALGDPTRRAILAQLERKDGATVSELAKPFAIKLPAVMKHLDVLNDAGLITRAKSGRTVTVKLRPRHICEAMEWLRRYERFWSESHDRLTVYAESKEGEARAKRR